MEDGLGLVGDAVCELAVGAGLNKSSDLACHFRPPKPGHNLLDCFVQIAVPCHGRHMALDNDSSVKSVGGDACSNLKGQLGCSLEMDKETVKHCKMFVIELLPQRRLGDVLRSEGGV